MYKISPNDIEVRNIYRCSWTSIWLEREVPCASVSLWLSQCQFLRPLDWPVQCLCNTCITQASVASPSINLPSTVPFTALCLHPCLPDWCWTLSVSPPLATLPLNRFSLIEFRLVRKLISLGQLSICLVHFPNDPQEPNPFLYIPIGQSIT